MKKNVIERSILGGLIVANLVSGGARAEVWLGTLILTLTSVYSFYYLLHKKRNLAGIPVLDLAFCGGTVGYYVLPGVFYLVEKGERIGTLSLQQGIMGSCVAALLFFRSFENWTSWRKITANVERNRSRGELQKYYVLLAITVLWIVAVLPYLGGFISMAYGTRASGQRNPLTIGLLGFTYFGIMWTAIALYLRSNYRNSRKWMCFNLFFYSFYGLLCVYVFSTRTRLIWVLMLGILVLLKGVKIRFRTVLLAVLAFIIMIPVFNVIGRARYSAVNVDSIVGAVNDTSKMSSSKIISNSELIRMVYMGDVVIRFQGDKMYMGKYIALAILKSPPAFVLRPFELDEVTTMGREFIELYDPRAWERGEGFGLALSAEAYCNFGVLGGIISAFILFVFLKFFELILQFMVPARLAAPLAVTFALNVAKVNRNGLESLPKVAMLLLVFIALWQGLSFFSRMRR